MSFLKKISDAVSNLNDPGRDIHAAAAKGETKKVKKILNAYPLLVNERNHDGDTPLHIASTYNMIEVARLLLAAGADANIANQKEATPLHKAAFMGSTDVFKMLLENGADYRKTCKGVTVLEMAKQAGRKGIIELLQDRMNKKRG